MSMVSKASCRSRSRRSRLLSEVEATPPLPVFPPARCWKSIFAVWWSHLDTSMPRRKQKGRYVHWVGWVVYCGHRKGIQSCNDRLMWLSYTTYELLHTIFQIYFTLKNSPSNKETVSFHQKCITGMVTAENSNFYRFPVVWNKIKSSYRETWWTFQC